MSGIQPLCKGLNNLYWFEIVSRTSTLNEEDLERLLNGKEEAENIEKNKGKKPKYNSQDSKRIPPLDKNIVVSMPSSQEKKNSEGKSKEKKASKNSKENDSNFMMSNSDLTHNYESSNLIFAPKIAEKKNGNPII